MASQQKKIICLLRQNKNKVKQRKFCLLACLLAKDNEKGKSMKILLNVKNVYAASLYNLLL
jgi:hypothetical protein